MQSSLPAGWLAFTGRESNPLDHYKRFQITLSSPSSGFILAQRTAGFPQYGWKAGCPSGAFPMIGGLSRRSKNDLRVLWSGPDGLVRPQDPSRARSVVRGYEDIPGAGGAAPQHGLPTEGELRPAALARAAIVADLRLAPSMCDRNSCVYGNASPSARSCIIRSHRHIFSSVVCNALHATVC